MNDFGSSNWAKVNIKIAHENKPSGMLEVVVLLGVSMMIGTLCGMLRAISLQFLLVPYRPYAMCGKTCGWACAPPPEETKPGMSAGDFKPDFMTDDGESMQTQNPLGVDAASD
eukprot:SAG11_NODE_2632_length_3152_cov_1.729774_4_plen_113_part_00